MHYKILVVLDDERDEEDVEPLDVTAQIESALAPHKNTEWDWYQLGGRWTGMLGDYDPTTDPANREPCDLCGGTGDRQISRQETSPTPHGCNRCQGTGIAQKWPTEWAKHPGDVLPLEQLTQEQLDGFYAVVQGGHWFARERYTPWAKRPLQSQEMPTLTYLHGLKSKWCPQPLVVVVDCHY